MSSVILESRITSLWLQSKYPCYLKDKETISTCPSLNSKPPWWPEEGCRCRWWTSSCTWPASWSLWWLLCWWCCWWMQESTLRSARWTRYTRCIRWTRYLREVSTEVPPFIWKKFTCSPTLICPVPRRAKSVCSAAWDDQIWKFWRLKKKLPGWRF